MDTQTDSIIILRCCRDWPCHVYMAYGTKGRCGICHQVPDIINEPYPQEQYAKNKPSQLSWIEHRTSNPAVGCSNHPGRASRRRGGEVRSGSGRGDSRLCSNGLGSNGFLGDTGLLGSMVLRVASVLAQWLLRCSEFCRAVFPLVQRSLSCSV